MTSSIISTSSSNNNNNNNNIISSSNNTNATNILGQGVAVLLMMIAILWLLLACCSWGAQLLRKLRRRNCYCTYCCCCRYDVNDETNDSETGGFSSSSAIVAINRGNNDPNDATTRATRNSAERAMIAAATPTIILLPHGRTFVVHGRIFTQLQADDSGLDLVELGESMMRAQRTNNTSSIRRNNSHNYHQQRRQLQESQGSIIDMDADTPSKDSIGSIGCFPPPTYESIYGKDEDGADLPPSYSDIVLHRLANLSYEFDMQQRNNKDDPSNASQPRIIDNPIAGNYSHQRYSPQYYSSRSLPRRNPSLISNPLDDYYVDNELAGITIDRRRQRRRSSIAAEVTSRTTTTELTGMGAAAAAAAVVLLMAGGNEADSNDDNSRHDSDELAAENVTDNRFSSSLNQGSRTQNDLMNSRNVARDDSRLRNEAESEDLLLLGTSSDVLRRSRQRRVEESPGDNDDNEVDDQARINRRLSGIGSEPNDWSLSEVDSEGRADINASADDEEVISGNFQALADIRESRV